jgi:probable HAF family extracellular repeat protein
MRALIAAWCACAGVACAQSIVGIGYLEGGVDSSECHAIASGGSLAVGAASGSSGVLAVRFDGTALLELGDLAGGTVQSLALAVSADGGVIVGRGEESTATRAFRKVGVQPMVSLGVFPAFPAASTEATGCNADGSIVVGRAYWFAGAEQRERAFLWSVGGMAGLGEVPGGSWDTRAFGVSADGVTVVGSASRAVAGGVETRAFVWTVNDEHTFLPLLVGTTGSEARAVSADGSVVVGQCFSTGAGARAEACVWTFGVAEGLGDLPGFAFASGALGVSADGTTVVGFGTTDAGSEAFVWTRASGLRRLGDALAGADLTHWRRLAAARGVSADGRRIVGVGVAQGATLASEGFVATLGDAACAADLDDGSGSGTPDQGVTIEDLIYFLDAFQAGDTAADLDDGSGTGVRDGGVTIEDLIYFLQHFFDGC